ncbi:dTDP-4-dehydrorhamnose reductase [Paenibacillus jiagnxiensis]|uniref:dTDP-4-dehydrorhamnose reductase n=1 Tax=Paenibacillus jiagnxiensis TaxID=3228926 RepID=UPI0033B53A7B
MDKYKIIVTGANGQLGVDMVEHLKSRGHLVYGYGRQELDITNHKQVNNIIHDIRPEVIVHCGAYTKVDLAEAEPEQAYLVNGYGTRNVAVAAEVINAKLVYLSTDYVFNGEAEAPYDEFEKIEPINVYGRSKRMGESFVERLHSKHFIVRTSWVYGEHGSNFVKTMIKLGLVKKSVSVVNDQIGCPTYTKDLAESIGRLFITNKYGTYHISNSGHCSWYEFAKAVFRLTGIEADVIPVTSEQFVRPAKRPKYSVFNHMALKLNGFPMLRHWEDGLNDFLQASILNGKYGDAPNNNAIFSHGS